MATFIVQTFKEYLRVDADCAREAESYVQYLISHGLVEGEIIDSWEMIELFLDDEVED